MPSVSTPFSANVFYRKFGSGPALTLLHGFPESGMLWKDVWDGLARKFTVIIPDFPGSGDSPLDQPAGMDEMAECVSLILQQEDIQETVVAGHSMGGYVALAFARLYPEKTKGISLVHSTPDPDDDEKKLARKKIIDLIQKGGKVAFINQMVPNLFSDAFKQLSPALVKEHIAGAQGLSDSGLINFYNAMIRRNDSNALLENTRLPLQWILGTEDTIISYKKILDKTYKSGINFVVIYNECGHMSMVENPVGLVHDLNEFTTFCYLCHYETA